MKFAELEVKDWFKWMDMYFIKTVRIICGAICYVAVSLDTGEPAFMSGECGDREVELIAKPEWLESKADETPKTEEWSIRYDTAEQRMKAESVFRLQFPDIEVRHEEKHGVFLLVADVPPEVHGKIKELFGGT